MQALVERPAALNLVIPQAQVEVADPGEALAAALERQPVALADEFSDERRGRTVVDFLGRGVLLDLAVVHHGNAVGHQHGLVLVVGDHQRGDTQAPLQLAELEQAIERIRGGDFAARVEHLSSDEFGTLAQGFNDMADMLQSIYRNLEQRVSEKTHELEEKRERLEGLYEVTNLVANTTALGDLVRCLVPDGLAPEKNFSFAARYQGGNAFERGGFARTVGA